MFKKCPVCASVNEGAAPACAKCGHVFRGRLEPPRPASAPEQAFNRWRDRPALRHAVLLALALLAWLAWSVWQSAPEAPVRRSPPPYYGPEDPHMPADPDLPDTPPAYTPRGLINPRGHPRPPH